MAMPSPDSLEPLVFGSMLGSLASEDARLGIGNISAHNMHDNLGVLAA